MKRRLNWGMAGFCSVLLTVGLLSACGGSEQEMPEDLGYVSNPDGIENQIESGGAGDQEMKDLTPFINEMKGLEGEAALAYFESLPDKGLTEAEILQFFIDLPLSDANPGIVARYKEEEFAKYMATYPRGTTYDGYAWQKGNGTDFHGAFSELDLKIPFSNYVGLLDGPVGNEEETYIIGVAIHGFDQPWCVSLADAAQWEANRHPNVEVIVKDGQWDNDQMADIIDSFIL